MMKSVRILSMVAAASMAAAPWALATEVVKVDVPFDFVVAGQPLPSGEYRFVTGENATLVHVYSKTRGHVALAVCQPVPNGKEDAGLVFHQHSGQRFLKTVVTGHGLEISLPTTRAERVAEAADGVGPAVAVRMP